jgi:GNAT superfamily N-acetyltransferase
MNSPRHLNLCERILRADEVNLSYFAERVEWPGVALFYAERADAPEFDVALIYDVPASDADATLQAIGADFRTRGRRPRLRLSPLSIPADWPGRLRRAGFVETGERHAYFTVPESVHLVPNPAVEVRRAVSPHDAARFAAIQIAGFEIPVEHQAWERALAARHFAAGRHAFYVAYLNDRPVGAARSIRLPGVMTSMAALATLPESRGRGVGTSLLARMIDDARVAGSRAIFGAVVAGSSAAALYERLGFVTRFATRTFTEVPGSGVTGLAGRR